MSTNANTEEQQLLSLAKEQLTDFEALILRKALVDNHELEPQLRAAATAVVNSIEEGTNMGRNETFRKNFFVVAKGCNKEYRLLLAQWLEIEGITLEGHRLLHRKNIALENALLAAIRRRQSGGKTPEASKGTSA